MAGDKDVLEIVDRIMSRVERDGAFHRSSLAEEIESGLIRLLPSEISTAEAWRFTPALFKEFKAFMRDRAMNGTMGT